MTSKMVLLEIMEAFHTIKEQYRQLFLISHESDKTVGLSAIVQINVFES